jgi:hypothetical protein
MTPVSHCPRTVVRANGFHVKQLLLRRLEEAERVAVVVNGVDSHGEDVALQDLIAVKRAALRAVRR